MEEKMSDAEIREELMALGEKSVGPITETTRPLYLKKLARLKSENKKKKLSNQTPVRKPLSALSSDESEDELRNTSQRNSSRNTLTVSRTANKSMTSVTKQSPPKKSPSRVTKSTNSVTRQETHNKSHAFSNHNGGVDEEDDDNNISMKNASLQASFNSTFNRTHGRDDGYLKHTSNDIGNEFSDSDREDGETSKYTYSPNSSRTSTVLQESTFRHRFGNTKPGPFSARYTDFLESTRTPNLSTRLRTSYVDQTGVMGTDGLKTKEIAPSYSLSQYISFALLILALAFFAVLACMYISMQRVEDAREQESTKIMCGTGDSSPECSKKMSSSYKVAKQILATLMDQAGQYECSNAPHRDMKIDSVLAEVANGLGQQMHRGEKGEFDTALQLFVKNKNWNVRLYDADKKETDNLAYVDRLESLDANMGLFCRISRAVQRMIRSLVLLFSLIMVSLMFIWYVRCRWRKMKEEQRQVFSLVEKIIHILKEHSDACLVNKDLEPYVAIPHVRDQLIPLRDRKRMQYLWQKAVQFLSENESRVREEVETIQGEEFPVWRWIQPNANGGKYWQGQAFGEGKDAPTQKLSFVPLPCLKIRNMFNLETEFEPDWHIKVQDAILEKCGPGHGIVHIAVDKTSKEGCVYVKCNSREAAGQAFSAINGSWFDSRLVTVKFLRLERYHERFPEAEHCTHLMKPSNDARESLAKPFHRSFLEQC